MSSKSGNWKSNIVVALIGAIAGIVGTVIAQRYERDTAGEAHIVAIAMEILDRHSQICPDKSKQNEFTWRVLDAAVRKEKEYLLDLIKERPCREEEPEEREVIVPAQPPTPKKANLNMELGFSCISSHFNVYTKDFYCPNIFLLVKSDQKIKQLIIDWDDGNGYQKVSRPQYNKKQGVYVTDHYYTPDGKKERSISVKAQLQDGTMTEVRREEIQTIL